MTHVTPRGRDTAPHREQSPWGDERGASVVEVLVALIVLSFGMLGMAGTTAMVVRQTTMAELAARRAAVVQQVAEQARTIPFDSLANGSDIYGKYGAAWYVTDDGPRAKEVLIVTIGPGAAAADGETGMTVAPVVADTVRLKVLRQ